MDIEKFTAFYLEGATATNGLTLLDSIQYDQLEERHDFFQYIFPIDRISDFNKDAPSYDNEMADFFKKNASARTIKIMAAMLFWKYLETHPTWPKPLDHNNLRLSRVFRSLALSSLEQHGHEIYRKLIRRYATSPDSFSLNSFDHWRSNLIGKKIYFYEECKELREQAKELLPDHQVIKLAKGELDQYLELNEPILVDVGGFDYRPEQYSFENRGRLYNYNELLKHGHLENYLIDIRVW